MEKKLSSLQRWILAYAYRRDIRRESFATRGIYRHYYRLEGNDAASGRVRGRAHSALRGLEKRGLVNRVEMERLSVKYGDVLYILTEKGRMEAKEINI